MSDARHFIAARPGPTGCLADQPRAEHTLSGWYFDRDLNYQSTGFLDAPAYVPTGSVRALDTGDLCLAIADRLRDREGARG